MRLTPAERDRLLLRSTAEPARARWARGLKPDVPQATALIADTVCEAARDGRRLTEAIEEARTALGPDDVLPGFNSRVGAVDVDARSGLVSPGGEPLRSEAAASVSPNRLYFL